jgi:hypothetical protein
MEPRFSHDFSQVRIHTGDSAVASARAVSARAYTVGRHIVFDASRYQPGSADGKKLLAHELTHVLQQGRSDAAPENLTLGSPHDHYEQEAERIAGAVEQTPANALGAVSDGALRGTPSATASLQRDFATPEPATPPAAQTDLTDAQISSAISFNTQRYDRANTRLIQGLLGEPATGQWTKSTIIAIAATQEQFGLTKDGKVGSSMFDFIVREQGLEGAGTETKDCLTSFSASVFPVQTATTAGPGGTTTIVGHHVVEARFSPRCNCSQFQYRQFISGTATGSRGTATQNLSNLFPIIPGGQLPAASSEDGNTNCPGVNYGHREQPGQNTTAACGENRYTDGSGTVDQANGCFYRGEDFPKITVNGLLTGDIVFLQIQFRGEIRRNGVVIETKQWTTVNQTITTP